MEAIVSECGTKLKCNLEIMDEGKKFNGRTVSDELMLNVRSKIRYLNG